MLDQAHTSAVLGIEAHPSTVEVDVTIGLSAFNIVGLPDNMIWESRDRILAALSNYGITLPPGKSWSIWPLHNSRRLERVLICPLQSRCLQR